MAPDPHVVYRNRQNFFWHLAPEAGNRAAGTIQTIH